MAKNKEKAIHTEDETLDKNLDALKSEPEVEIPVTQEQEKPEVNPEGQTEGDTDGDKEEAPKKDEPEVDEEDLPPHVVATDIVPKTEKVVKESLPKHGIVVECEALRIREGASISTRPLTEIKKGTKVKIEHLNSTELFYAVEYKDEQTGVTYFGFSLKKFIKLV